MYGKSYTLKSGRPPTGSLANRPSSKAGLVRAPQTAQGSVPRTAMVKMQLMQPPSTGSRSNPPRTGFRIPNRPTTQQGMGGMRLNTAGLGRQVQDASYFQSILRQKLASIVEETNKLNVDLENANKENSNYAVFENKADEMAAELRELQGQLGDYNMLVDKLKTNFGVEDFEREITELRKKNANYAANQDDIFKKRKEMEHLITQAEEEMIRQQENAESLIHNLDPAKQDLFGIMKQENEANHHKIQQLKAQLDQLSKEYSSMHEKLSHDLIKQKAVYLYQKLAQAKERKSELELIIKKAEMESGPQERSRLLEQVKNDNLETSGMERKIAEYEESIAKLKQEMVAHSQNDPEKQAKFDQLVKREKEMQEFMDVYPLKVHEIKEQNLSAEVEITDSLMKIQNISQKINAAAPSKESFNDVSNTLKMKSSDLRNSTNTLDALAHERNQRLQDLEKVEQLESKLDTELHNLVEKITGLRTAITEISDVDGAKATAEGKLAKTQLVFQDVNAREVAANRLFTEISYIYNEKRSALEGNETFNHLSSQEAKMRQIEANNFEIRDYISQKKSQSNYVNIKEEVMNLTEEINNQLLKIAQLAPAR